jgi:hypothetical protein
MNAIIQNIPYFEIDGTRYTIKRNRYLQAEFDEMKKSRQFNDDEELEYVREQELTEQLEKLSKRKDELYDKYLDTFDEEDEAKYNKARMAYDILLVKLSETRGVTSKKRKELIEIGEALIIKALQINDNGDTIRTEEQAKDIWSSFREEFGEVTKMEFVIFTINYIVGNDDDDTVNPFIAQAKAKAEQKANMRKGISKAK